MIKREFYMKKIRPFINNEIIKVLTGFRRSGKSVMLDLIKQELLENGCTEEQFITLNFEKMENEPLCNARSLHKEIMSRAKKISNGKKVYIFLDEIQEVDKWEKCVNSLRLDIDCDIYITGSNAKLLSGELATYLAGRYVEFIIYPFSFSEFKELYTTISPNTNNDDCFNKYLTFGGMPYISQLNYAIEPSRLYLEDLYNSVVLKDIVKRNKIRDVALLEKIIAYVVTNIGMTFSVTSISKYFKSEGRTVAPETIMNYINYCINAYLFYTASRENIKGKEILSTNEKYYIVDQGLREAVFGGNIKDQNLILENIVYMEMLRRGYDITVGQTDNREVDFICKKPNERIYIQVSYLLASDETVEREFSVLEKIRDNYPKYVLSMDKMNFSRNGIIHKNIIDFLLEM